MAETNVEVARRGFEAVMVGDFDTIAGMLDDDVKWHGGNPSETGSCQNRDQALEFMRRARRQGVLGELVDIIGAGDNVVVIIRPRAKDGSQAPPVANLTTFRDGKVVEMVHYPNPKHALQAAGLSA